MNFRDKIILAPMVRVSTHPFRLLSLRYGADLVYVEEIVDLKLIESKRVVNELLGTIDYIGSDETIVFRTSKEEKDRLVLQLGTSDPDTALQAALHVQNDVSAIDVNMGCPKDYSVKGGMGSALLTQPERIKAILENLVNNLKIPVTCKIRVLPNVSDTIELVKMIEKTGVSAVAIHGRMKTDRMTVPCRLEQIKKIKANCSVPIIANGGSKEYINLHSDVAYFKELTGADSVMLARAAMWNPAIFMDEERLIKFQNASPDGYEIECARDYLKLAVKYEHNEAGTKYCLLRMLLKYSDTELYVKITKSESSQEICDYLNIDYEPPRECVSLESAKKRIRLDDMDVSKLSFEACSDTHVDYDSCLKSKYESVQHYPKQILYSHSIKEKIDKPIYKTMVYDSSKKFYGSVKFNNQCFISMTGYRQKRFAEQSAALACLNKLGIDQTIS